MISAFIQTKILVLALSFLIDVIIGEPSERIHLTVFSGKTINFLEGKLNQGNRLRIKGAAAVILASASFGLITFLTLRVLQGVSLLLYIIVSAFILKMTFSIRSMDEHVKPIANALEIKDLSKARRLLSRISRRNTSNLDKSLVSSGTVEAVAEGTVDGVISPIFFFIILGVPGAVIYRVINTSDSIVGYRNRHFREFGWFTAKLDTALNFVPARLAAFFMLSTDFKALKKNFSFILISHGKTNSANAGWPLSSMSARLRIRLEKKGFYIIGKKFKDPSWQDIRSSLIVMKITVLYFIVTMMLAIILLNKAGIILYA